MITARRSPTLPAHIPASGVRGEPGEAYPSDLGTHVPVFPVDCDLPAGSPAAFGFRLLERPTRCTDLNAWELIDPMKGDPDDRATASHRADRQRP